MVWRRDFCGRRFFIIRFSLFFIFVEIGIFRKSFGVGFWRVSSVKKNFVIKVNYISEFYRFYLLNGFMVVISVFDGNIR